MAYLALLWKARTIEKCRLKYEKEKINSILATNKDLPKNSLYQKWTVYRNDSQKRIQLICGNWCPEGSKAGKLCTCLREKWSFVLKIVIGLVGGIALTYFWYKVVVFEFAVWAVMSWIVAVALTLGIAFSYRVRCLVLLLIPGLFSRVGRYTLACYALVLILTGPATNTLKNLDTLSDSLACGQEQIKSSVKQIKESKHSPLNLVKETMSGTVEKIQQLASKMKELMVKVHRLTMSIAHVLQSSLSWLNSVEATCNKELGTPYDHCTDVLANGVKDCEEQFPETSAWDWGVIVRAICFTLKPSESICVVGDFAKGSIVATVKKKLDTFSSRIQSLLYVSVHIRRSHSCCSNGSLPISQAAAGIVTDLRNRADPLLTWLSWSCTLTGLFLLLIIFRAKYYQHMFRTRSRFDNRYVTKELRELDLKRQRQGRETVLPLNTRERAKYVSTASIRLLPSERLYLTRSIVFMVITTFKLMIHMVADYSLYWVLMNIRFHGSTPTNFQQSNGTANIHISGSGPLAAIVRMLVESLSVPLIHPEPSPNSCLPDPKPPDLQRYAQIGSLILLLWLLALFEPYGLRLRHVITGHYQPERAKARAVWLYYHIIRTRSCFLKYARRKLHRQYKYTSEEKLTFKRWLNDCIPCRWLRCLLRVGPDKPHCLLCYTKHHQEDIERHLKRCDTPSCPGVYCARCFMDIGQLCTICYSPEDYGDLSDVSLEKFTSDDSESDDSDDDCNDDIRPILGTANYQEQQKKATSSKPSKKNEGYKIPQPKNKDNHELKPLLDYDYLKKGYDLAQNQVLKCDTACKHPIRKQNDTCAQKNETTLKTDYAHINENICNEEFAERSLHSLAETKQLPTFNVKEITVKGVTIPKGKLGAVVKTMMLLTTKVNDEECNKDNISNKHVYKPFEYLVMEMFQPFEVLRKITLAKHIRCANRSRYRNGEIDETFKNEMPVVYTGPKVEENTSYMKALSNLPKHIESKDSEVRCLHLMKYDNRRFLKRQNNGDLLKRYRKMCCAKRNVKRFLEIKKIISNDLIKKLRRRNIYCKKRKFSRRRRRRRNENCLYLNLIALVSKVFSNKAIKNEGLDVAYDKNMSVNEPNEINLPNEQQKYEQSNLNYVIQESEFCIKKHGDNFSHKATAGSCDIKSNNRVTDGSHIKRSNESDGIELERKSDRKIIELEIRETTPKKLGFWTSLCLRKRANHSPRTFASCGIEKPLSNNESTNHKKRKKLPNDNPITVVNTAYVNRKVNDEARSYRISLYLKDREWFSKTAKYNTILDVKNDDTLVGLDSKTSKRLAKEMERLRKEEIKNMKREEKLKRSNEAKIKKAERKTKLAKEKKVDKKKRVRAGGECDEQNEKNNEIKLKPSRIDLDLLKRLKSISKMTLKVSKHRGIDVSNAEVKFAKDCDAVNNKIVNGNSKGEENQIDKTYSPAFYYNPVNLNDINKTVSQETANTLQNFECQLNSHDYKPSEVTFDFEDEQYEDGTQTALKPKTIISSCSHIWYVEPKKQGTCQTDETNDKHLNMYHTGPNKLHTTSRCFQVGVKSDKDMKFSSDKSLKNSKRTQLTTIYNKLKKSEKDKVIKTREDKEVTACPELESRGSQYEVMWQTDKQTQVRRSHSGTHVETQCAVLFPLQTSAVETERTETRACSSQCRPVLRDQVIRELTESIVPPYVTIEYTDEKPLKVKRTRINDIVTSNQSTTTDTKTLANVSTTTSDWWSPILERKDMRRKQGVTTIQEHSQEDIKCRGAAAGTALNVKRQCHPPDTVDILSPSRYLMQSQYCNQIYSMHSVSPMGSSRVQRNHELERPSRPYHKQRKGTKTKRLEECYSPRKRIQSSTLNLVPAKWQPATEDQGHALKYYKRRSSKNSSHKPRKVKHDKEWSRNMQSTVWTASIFSSSY